MNLQTSASIDGNGYEAEPDDKELVLAFKRGEDGSYQAIYDRYSRRISGICRRMLDGSHDAEEAQQEAFMRIYTGLPNFNGRYQLGAWVSRIATNVCLDHIRSKGRKPADSTDQSKLVDLSEEPSDGPEESFIKGDERQRVREVLSVLAPSHRAALALREFEGMSYADIAVALGMTEPQVKALIHRARRAFKKRWAHGLALLLPWRLLARLRRFSSHYDAPPHLADAAASTANFASSCSAALQQCGAFVTDKMAGGVAALLVGAATVAVVAPTAPPEPRKNDGRESVVVQAAVREPKTETDPKGPRKKDRKVVVAPAPVEEETEAAPPAAEEEEPTADTEEEENAEQPDDSSKPPVDPAPAGLYTYFGWDRGESAPRATATSHTTDLDCEAQSLAHTVDTWISDGAFSYRATFQFFVSASASSLEFRVFKENRELLYSDWGTPPAVTWARQGDQTRLEITGDYGARYGYDPDAEKLPQSGHFDATLTLDCAALSVVTEGAVFTAE